MKVFGFLLEEPDARQSALVFAQYRFQDHRPSSFFCESAHAPKRFAHPIDQRAKQSYRLFVCYLQKGEFAVYRTIIGNSYCRLLRALLQLAMRDLGRELQRSKRAKTAFTREISSSPRRDIGY